MTKVTDNTIESAVSSILRYGVLISGSIVLAGGVYYLSLHGLEPTGYQRFTGQPAQDRLVGEIIAGAFHLRARSVIQVGILCLIATPIVRVAYSLFGFAQEGDRTYVLITALVLAVLLSSLLSGAAGGV